MAHDVRGPWEIVQSKGDDFEIVVDWDNGTKGQYSGHFDPIGNLTGVTFDVNHPSAQATWFRQQ